jgi:hypothetical protein
MCVPHAVPSVTRAHAVQRKTHLTQLSLTASCASVVRTRMWQASWGQHSVPAPHSTLARRSHVYTRLSLVRVPPALAHNRSIQHSQARCMNIYTERPAPFSHIYSRCMAYTTLLSLHSSHIHILARMLPCDSRTPNSNIPPTNLRLDVQDGGSRDLCLLLLSLHTSMQYLQHYWKASRLFSPSVPRAVSGFLGGHE